LAFPQASALTKSNVMTNISTASFGNSKICGDHKCAPGEHTQWINAVWQSQKVSYGKIGSAPHGEDVMQKIVGSTPSSDGNTKKMPGNTETPIEGYK
jgi:hypothetical protein